MFLPFCLETETEAEVELNDQGWEAHCETRGVRTGAVDGRHSRPPPDILD